MKRDWRSILGFERPECSCKHVGNCLLTIGPEWRRATWPDGTLVYREVTPDEDPAVRSGDIVGTTGHGDMFVVARAIDPERVVAWTQTLRGRRCMGGRDTWRAAHPFPEPDPT